MLRPYLSLGKPHGFHALIAADDLIGAVPDLQPIIHDFERKRGQRPRRNQKKRPELPVEPSTPMPSPPDTEHHVDDYA